MFIKTVFQSSFSLAYVLFVATLTAYYVDEVFGVPVYLIRDKYSFPSGRKSVVSAAIGVVVASNAVVPASKGSLGEVSLCDSQ